VTARKKKAKVSWGGARKGAGRPEGSAHTEGWVTRSIVMRPDLDKRVDRARKGQTRSAWVAEACERELKRLERAATRRKK